jgi:hypothetical protein
MIEISPGYKTGGLWFPTIQEAQKLELLTLLYPEDQPNDVAKAVINLIVVNTDEVVAILTCHPKAATKRKPRSDIGTKRKAKGEVAQEGEK